MENKWKEEHEEWNRVNHVDPAATRVRETIKSKSSQEKKKQDMKIEGRKLKRYNVMIKIHFIVHRAEKDGKPPTEERIIVETVESILPVPRVDIRYCTQCNWMLRSAWMQQELLTTFNGTLAAVTLVPDHTGGGTFEVRITTADEEAIVWNRTEAQRFPESKELKQRVRDVVDPKKSLGHSDAEMPAAESGTGRKAFQRLLSVVLGDRRGSGRSS